MNETNEILIGNDSEMEDLLSQGQQPYKLLEQKNMFTYSVRKKFNSHWIGLGHQHGCLDGMSLIRKTLF